jgi:leucyl-tRNA---protein transferase
MYETHPAIQSTMSTPQSTPQDLPTLVAYDELDPCPYLSGRTARLPLQYPLWPLSGRDLDERLAAGYRRLGEMVYRTACPACQACEAVRVLVDEFRPNRGQRRVWRKGQVSLRVELGPCRVDARRVRLYNGHKQSRGLDHGEGPITTEGYRSFLVETCCDSFELRYLSQDRLVGVAVADRGDESLSAVYCYFDPEFNRLSPGTFSVLQQIELCRSWGLKYLYLGYYIGEPCRMTYKATFRPHERLAGGEWLRHD